MFTVLGWILFGFAALSAVVILLSWFGMKDLVFQITDPDTCTAIDNGHVPAAKANIPASTTKVDVGLTSIGKLFVYGGAFATILSVLSLLLAPRLVLCLKHVCCCTDDPCGHVHSLCGCGGD